MKQSAAPLLSCPRTIAGKPCSGFLVPGALPGLPLRKLEGNPDEILEGGLTCGTCAATYPILSGVGVLVPEPDRYLSRYHDSLLRDIDRHGSLSSAGKNWLARQVRRRPEQMDYGADFRFSQQFERPWDIARAMTEDPEALYGAFGEWLQGPGARGPYDVLAEWCAELVRDRPMVLDAGCGPGGLLSRVAPRFPVGFGVDLSFLAVLLARRAILHLPDTERTYLLTGRIGHEVERPLTLPPAPGAEVVVGDCEALPFAPGLFDCVCSANVIDMADLNRTLDEAVRVLRPGGTLLLTDPFYFKQKDAPEGEPVEVVRAGLVSRGLRIERERDGVPWAWATYQRHWRLYFSYCVAATRQPDPR